jgi:hypothetical protein
MQQRFPNPLDAGDVAHAIVGIASSDPHRGATLFDLTAGCLEPV